MSGIAATNDVIVVFELPKRTTSPVHELSASVLLEGFDEFHQVTCLRRAGGKHVDMVRHYAVRVDEELAENSVFL